MARVTIFAYKNTYTATRSEEQVGQSVCKRGLLDARSLANPNNEASSQERILNRPAALNVKKTKRKKKRSPAEYRPTNVFSRRIIISFCAYFGRDRNSDKTSDFRRLDCFKIPSKEAIYIPRMRICSSYFDEDCDVTREYASLDRTLYSHATNGRHRANGSARENRRRLLVCMPIRFCDTRGSGSRVCNIFSRARNICQAVCSASLAAVDLSFDLSGSPLSPGKRRYMPDDNAVTIRYLR